MNLINFFLKDMITNPNGSFSTKRVMSWVILIQMIILSFLFVLLKVELSVITAILTSFTTLFITLVGSISYDNKKYYQSLTTVNETFTKDNTESKPEDTGL